VALDILFPSEPMIKAVREAQPVVTGTHDKNHEQILA
jgi:hypothetical protein